MSESFKVTILGTEYSLRTNDEELVSELAAELDTELKDLQQKLPGKPPTTLAVLTALNTSEQYAHAQMNELREIERLTAEIDDLCDSLEGK
ncbi:MAG: cell division protein ZapA [Bacteroidota bacterium]|nr:cell division protein ZapA [Bacteroidota bacterium]MDP4229701.1 cell division protein ZapA [Bacteroidota bacterium]MDP4236605.1 cell division protein ZapA [Bacteroidota bacterium]